MRVGQVGRLGRDRRVGQVRQGANSRRSVGSWGRTLLVVSALGIAACSGPRETAPATEPARATEPAAHDAHIVARSGLAMGSELTLMAWTADEDVANRAFDAAFGEFDRLDKLMSVWKPDSDVVRLNASAGTHPVPVSRDTLDALLAARQVSDWTNGKFDVTFGAL